MEEPSVKSTVKIRHNPHKLKFLEGLGLVTVDKKKGNLLCKESEPTSL